MSEPNDAPCCHPTVGGTSPWVVGVASNLLYLVVEISIEGGLDSTGGNHTGSSGSWEVAMALASLLADGHDGGPGDFEGSGDVTVSVPGTDQCRDLNPFCFL